MRPMLSSTVAYDWRLKTGVPAPMSTPTKAMTTQASHSYSTRDGHEPPNIPIRVGKDPAARTLKPDNIFFGATSRYLPPSDTQRELMRVRMAQTLRGDLTSQEEADLVDLLAEKVRGFFSCRTNNSSQLNV